MSPKTLLVVLVNEIDAAVEREEPVALKSNGGLVSGSEPVNCNPELTGGAATELEEATSVEEPEPNLKMDGAEVGNVAEIDGLLPMVAAGLLEKMRPVELPEATFVEVEETEIAEDVSKPLLCDELVEAPREKTLGMADVDTPAETVLSFDLYKLPISRVLSSLFAAIASGGVTGEVIEVPALLTNQKESQKMSLQSRLLTYMQIL